MAEISVQVDRDGSTEELTLDLDLSTLTMRESVRLEQILGEQTFAALGRQTTDTLTSPRVIQGVIFVKLKSVYPDIELDGFDLDLATLQNALEVDNPKAAASNGGPRP
jgi:hypothetical protein